MNDETDWTAVSDAAHAEWVRDEDRQSTPIGPRACPLTGRAFYGNIEHPTLGWVAVYGGPFFAHSIPMLSSDDELRAERYDFDEGAWVEGGMPIGHFYYDQQPDHAAEIARLRAEVARLDDGESQAIKERDHAEKIIDKLCDAVLGTERAEWSTGYYFEDAVDDVETAVYRLRAEADALRAGQKLVGYRWRHSAGEKWQYSDIPCGWEYEPLYAAMGGDA